MKTRLIFCLVTLILGACVIQAQNISSVHVIGYSSRSYDTSSDYQIGSGSAATKCSGSINGTLTATSPNTGQIDADTRTNCNTVYRSPQSGEIVWHHQENRNVVEGGGYRFVISCTATFRWSKCSTLKPNHDYQAEIQGGQMWITAFKNIRSSKTEIIKYDIVEMIALPQPQQETRAEKPEEIQLRPRHVPPPPTSVGSLPQLSYRQIAEFCRQADGRKYIGPDFVEHSCASKP